MYPKLHLWDWRTSLMEFKLAFLNGKELPSSFW